MLVSVFIPNGFEQERKYTIDMLMRYFDDIEVCYCCHSKKTTKFVVCDSCILEITDQFWSTLDETSCEYHKSMIPERMHQLFIRDKFWAGDLIGIYGDAAYSLDDGKLLLHTDIIASTFFMLTRWEEFANKKRDTYGRFEDQESLIHQSGFAHRPIVNEYIFFIKSLLEHHTGKDVKLNRTYQVYITHDVDELHRLRPFKKLLRTLSGDILLRKNPMEFLRTMWSKLLLETGLRKDPSDTFDYLMDISEKHGLRSRFYFIPGERGEYDYRYSISSKSAKDFIHKIVQRGHIVGIHPSLEVRNPDRFSVEMDRLIAVAQTEISEGRQHYLWFEVPYTWRKYEEHGLKYESTLGFRTCAGFRTGMCYAYPAFDILQRRQLDVMELPLTVMEVALTNQGYTPEELVTTIERMVNTVAHFEGDFVLLWHNNNIHHPFYRKFGEKYEEIIACIAKG